MFEKQLEFPFFRRIIRHKRWRYFTVQTTDLFFATAMVDVQYSGLIFYYLYDKKSKKIVMDRSFLKRPWEAMSVGDQAFGEDGFSLYSAGQKYWRFDGQNRQQMSLLIQGDLLLKVLWNAEVWQNGAFYAEGPVYSFLEQDYFHSTVKTSACLASEGEMIGPLGRIPLKGALITMDYSNGVLPRRVDWFWASAFNKDAGFNLQQGYFGDKENRLWFNGRWHSLGPAIFDTTTDSSGSWRVSSPEQRFDLVFKPEASRYQNQNLFLVKTFYEQPLGFFDGFVLTDDNERYAVRHLFGVAEKHESLW